MAPNRPGGYDLHTHSVFSDGTTTPAEIARLASDIGLTGFALTDHDTADGWEEARDEAANLGLDFLPGMEITTRDGYRSTHLLAYGLDPSSEELEAGLAKIRSSRVDRAQRMVALLQADFRISWDDIAGHADLRTVGRPHIADALVEAGYFPDRSAAFGEVLRPGSPYYLPTFALSTMDAIALVRDAGGVPVLAHPAASRHSGPASRESLDRFTRAGLWGIELNHPENHPEWIPELAEATAELGLTVTGASDYHGAGKPNRLGEHVTPAEVIDRIRAQAAIPS